MSRFRRSFALAGTSWGVLRSEPTLFAFPVIGFLVNAVVAAVFAGLIVVAGLAQSGGAATTGNASGSDTTAVTLVGFVLLFVMYVVMAFVTTLFLAALVLGARERLQGRDATFGGSMRAALSKAPYLLFWSVFQATVSIVISTLSQKAGIFGKILAGMFGAAWNIVTFLTVPIIVNEDAGPIQALKRSGTLIKTTWGENLIGQAGFGIVGLLASLPAIVCLVLGIAALGPATALGIALLAVSVLLFAVVAAFISALSGVYRAALYEYATTGQTPEAFATVGLQDAFANR